VLKKITLALKKTPLHFVKLLYHKCLPSETNRLSKGSKVNSTFFFAAFLGYKTYKLIWSRYNDKSPVFFVHSENISVFQVHVLPQNPSEICAPNFVQLKLLVKVKQSRYKPGVAQRVPGS
jgi:hypothetical protein